MKITPKHQLILDVIKEYGGHIARWALIDILVEEHGFTRRSAAAYVAKSDLFGYWHDAETVDAMVFDARDMSSPRPITLQYAGREVLTGVTLILVRDTLTQWRTLLITPDQWTHITADEESTRSEIVTGITTLYIRREYPRLSLWLDVVAHGDLLLKEGAVGS